MISLQIVADEQGNILAAARNSETDSTDGEARPRFD